MQVARRADMSTPQPLPVDKARCNCSVTKVMTRCAKKQRRDRSHQQGENANRKHAQQLLWTQQDVNRCGSTRRWQRRDQESNAGDISGPAPQQPVQTKKVLGRFGFTFFTLKPRGVLMGMLGASGRSPLL